MWKTTAVLTLLLAGPYATAAPLACLIEPDKVAEIGSQSVGVIEKVNVERGDLVEAGQILAVLQAEVERASVNVASVRARADAEVNAAMAAHDLMQRKVVRARELFGKKFISQEAVDQAEAEARIASNRVAQAKDAQRVAQQELALTNTQLAQRSIRSPFAGVVTDRYRTEGERIEREPILRIAKVDPLRVEVIMPAAEFGQIVLGAPVLVNTDLQGLKDLRARVALIDRVIDAASNTFRVRLSLPNPDHRIPAGLRCKADFGGNAPLAYHDPPIQTRPRMIKVSTTPAIEPTTEAAPSGIVLKLTRPSLSGERRKK